MNNRIPAHDDVVSLAVLALLVEKPCHPYEMHRLIRQRANSFVTGMPRSLYRAVDRLVGAHLVEPRETERDGGRPERTIFAVTDEGRAEFHTWLFSLLSASPITSSLFNVAVSFLPHMGPHVVASALRLRVAEVEGQLLPAEAALKHIGPTLPRVCLLEVEHTTAILRAELNWLVSVLKDLESGSLTWGAASNGIQE